LLHKAKLAEHARAVGLDTPKSWLATSEEELLRLADEVSYPLLLKPTTQALFPARSKGSIARNPSELRAAYQHLAERAHASEITEFDPTSSLPIAQEFFTDASEAIYNISGFIRDGKLCGARAATKLLQLPRVLGVGVCFEEAPLDPNLAAGLERLAQRVGYDGVFEAEFVRSAGRDLLIDFNPRFYNQMGFDVARGLALPLLAYYDALRETPRCDEPSVQSPTGKVFVNSAAFKMMVMSQGLSGALSAEEAAEWLEWYRSSDDNRVDAVADPDDVWPGRVNTLRMMQQHLRHPRHFLRAIVMNR
jgi:predicted ATP-grasp superfamily ATP-dependent carboligase